MRARRRLKPGLLRGSLAVLCAGSLVLAACNGDNGNDVTAPAPDVTDEDRPDIDVDPGELTTDECFAAISAMAAAAAGAFAPDVDLDESLELLERVASAAPAGVRADFEVIVGAFEEFNRLLEDAGVDLDDPLSFADPDVQQALEGLGAIFDDPAVREASENIEAYFDEVCPDFAPDDDFDDFDDFDVP